jgi:hypothetical protein
VVIGSFVVYGLYAMYSQMKIEIQEEKIKHKGKF